MVSRYARHRAAHRKLAQLRARVRLRLSVKRRCRTLTQPKITNVALEQLLAAWKGVHRG
jgi:hypothetical protein